MGFPFTIEDEAKLLPLKNARLTGGTIYAENVTVDHVKNNLKIYASNSITIKHVSGEDNFFKINYKDIPTLNSKYNFIEKEIELLRASRASGTISNYYKLINTMKEWKL